MLKTQAEDLIELETFYEHVSGGLLLNALGLEPGVMDNDDILIEYQKHGFSRESHLYSLKKDGKLKAIIVLNISDVGLNLSDLTNCIHVFVLDAGGLSKDILYSTLSRLYKIFDQHEIPVLLYPVDYGDRAKIPYEKQYTQWVLNLQYLDPYFRFIKRLLRSV
jgi:hypothetical protein